MTRETELTRAARIPTRWEPKVRRASAGRRAAPFGAPSAELRDVAAIPIERHQGAYYIRLMVVDQPGVIADVADEVVVMYGGMVMEHADRMTTFTAYHHPYTEGLLQSLPAYGGERARLRPIPGQPPSPINPSPGCPFAARCPYVMDRCRIEMPPLAEAGSELGHRSACWLPHDRQRARACGAR